MAAVKIPLTLSKETKGTYVFGTTDEDAVVTSLYVKKSAYPDGAPKGVTLTLEAK